MPVGCPGCYCNLFTVLLWIWTLSFIMLNHELEYDLRAAVAVALSSHRYRVVCGTSEVYTSMEIQMLLCPVFARVTSDELRYFFLCFCAGDFWGVDGREGDAEEESSKNVQNRPVLDICSIFLFLSVAESIVHTGPA